MRRLRGPGLQEVVTLKRKEAAMLVIKAAKQ